MKKQQIAPNTVPTANIAVNKSRIKVYKNAGDLPTYYLKKGTEFSIELFNPTSDVILAKIQLNGVNISQGGLVLKPGQRFFLDRFLDVPKKFLFDTYEVSNTSEVQEAIKKNGDFKVTFHKEIVPAVPSYTHGILRLNSSSTGSFGFAENTYTSYSSNLPNSSLTSGIGGQSVTGGLNNSDNTIKTASYSSNDNIPTMDWMAQGLSRSVTDLSFDDSRNTENTISSKSLRSKKSLSLKSKKTVETGRVEAGSNSNQTFTYVDKKFEYSSFHEVEYKMLPISQKITGSEDLNVKRYCSDCGSKTKPNAKFCSQCGTKI